MKFGIDPGHKAPPDTGAEGFEIEQDLNQLIAVELTAMLKEAGQTVIDCHPKTLCNSVNDSLEGRCAIANTANCDYFVSIHHNAGGGTGSEVYAISKAAEKIALPVLKRLCALGFRNRGVKNGRFYVLRNTKMPAILIETCFIDNQADCDLWRKLGEKVIAQAIFDGLDDYLKFNC